MYLYDLANKIEAAVSKPEPGKLTRSEKQALRYMGATGYRIADHQFDNPLLQQTQGVANLYGMHDIGRVIIYKNRFPNASYMRESNTMFLSTALLEKLDKDELETVIGHEFAHRNQRNWIRAATTALIVTSVVAATYLTSKFKNNIGNYLHQKAEGKDSILWKGVNKLGTAVERAPWAISTVYGLIGYGVNWLAEFPSAAMGRYFERDADKQSAEKTKKPEALATALEKIETSVKELRENPRQIAPTDPVMKDQPVPLPPPDPEPTGFTKSVRELKQSHPPVKERTAVLREIARKQEAEAGVTQRA
jgi:Zn-dependent protease with chaperone function